VRGALLVVVLAAVDRVPVRGSSAPGRNFTSRERAITDEHAIAAAEQRLNASSLSMSARMSSTDA